MIPVNQLHIRVTFLLGAVGVLLLLRKPVRYPDKPGSKGFVLLVFALVLWLGSSGLSYFLPGLRQTLVLYNFLLFAIMLSSVGWFLMAVEFATRRLPSRRVLLVLGGLLVVHFGILWTNFFGIHELMYLDSTTVDNAVLDPDRGPLFWVHAVIAYGLILTATLLLMAEWVNTAGLRRRQAVILAVTPVVGFGANLTWLAGIVELSFDPTPIGTTVGVLILSYALYRAEFLEIVPVARQTVVEEMRDAVVILDERDRVVDWNRAASALFDVTDPVAGMTAARFFEPVPDETLAEFSNTAQTETEVSFELDGRTRYFSVLLSPVGVDETEPLGRVIVIRDVTPLKRREQQLLKQNEYLDEFAGVVSHDLQGPLMEIRGSADMAKKTGDLTHVDYVLDAADRMEQLVDDLLQLARTGQQIEDTETVQLAEITESAWQRVWSPEGRLTVADDTRIRADPDRLQQLLENLFHNSVEHGSTSNRSEAGDGVEHGTKQEATATSTSHGQRFEADGSTSVTVTVGTLPDGFYVEDDGPGIPSEKREQVFERGYTTSEDGSGLGLGIVRQIAGAHGWSVRATAAESGGARFEVVGIERDR